MRERREDPNLAEKIACLKKWIDESDNIVFFGGAGVSTESGIPDFRSVDGLYNQQYDYPPETIISHSFYQRNPKEFYRFYKNKMIFPSAKPNPAHLALAKLEQEGLFAPEHKKPLPAFPKCIGVVTSKTGAALQDIRNVLTRRWPSVQLLLCPVTVQGFEAAQQVADAIRKLDQRKEVDEIIVARGGGSREDLWVFNAEVIARAAYRCKKPLISAIGHEIDYTILDFVADRRAPTPSAAAELAVPDREEQKRILLDLQQNIRKNMQNRLDLCYNGLEQYNFVLEHGLARRNWQKSQGQLQQVQDAIRQQMQKRLHSAELQLGHAAALTGSLDPYKVLARGYTMVTAANGTILNADDLQPEKTIYVRSASRRAKCRVEAVEEINENTQKF